MHKVRIEADNHPRSSPQRLLIFFSLIEFIRLTLRQRQPRLNSESDPDHTGMALPRSCYQDETHAVARHFAALCAPRLKEPLPCPWWYAISTRHPRMLVPDYVCRWQGASVHY